MAGLQNSHLPTLLPGPEEKLLWNLILIECGHVRTAHIKVVDVQCTALPSQSVGMQSMEVDVEGDAVEVVDLCADWNTVRVRI
jgi:hypothetical protein